MIFIYMMSAARLAYRHRGANNGFLRQTLAPKQQKTIFQVRFFAFGSWSIQFWPWIERSLMSRDKAEDDQRWRHWCHFRPLLTKSAHNLFTYKLKNAEKILQKISPIFLSIQTYKNSNVKIMKISKKTKKNSGFSSIGLICGD